MNTSFHLRSILCQTLVALAVALPTARGESAFDERGVLVIGIDGVRADSVLPAEAPHLHELIAQGAVTYQAYAGGLKGTPSEQPTSSGPGWSSILTGVWRDKHGVRNNDFTGDHYDQYPHFFRRIKEVEPSAYLSSIVSWNPIDSSIVEPVGAFTDYRGKGQGGSVVARDNWVRDAAVAHLQSEDPDVLFLHFDQVDGAGHAGGYAAGIGSYLLSIEAVDELIGDVLDAIEARPNRPAEKWLVVVTTDHGGLGTSHGGQSDDERAIFVIVSGDGTSSVLSERELGHTVVPWTVADYLGIPVEASWGWEEPAFGLPPYPPSKMEVVPGVGNALVVRWQPPVDLEAERLLLKRNGKAIADLPLDAVQYVDEIPEGFFALQVVYSLEVEGAAKAIEPLQVEVNVPKRLGDELVLHWPLNGDAMDVSGGDHHGATSDSTAPLTVSGAFGGTGLELSPDGAASAFQVELTEALRFGRFTDFSLGLWVRALPGREGVLLANKPVGKSVSEGWILSINADGDLQWNMGDGVRHVTLRSLNAVSGGDWHHVGMAVDRLQNVALYLDGAAVASASIASLKSSDGAGPLSLGSDPLLNEVVNVQVDDLRIWRRLLAEREWSGLVEDRSVATQWRQGHFTFEESFDPEVGAWNADPDGDGRSNLEELALQTDPKRSDPGAVLTALADGSLEWVQMTGGTGDTVLNYRRVGVVSRLEQNDDLQTGSWRAVTDEESGAVTVDYDESGRHTVSWRPVIPDIESRRFFRLRYTLDLESVE